MNEQTTTPSPSPVKRTGKGSAPQQPKDTIRIMVRLGDEMLEPIIVPMNMMQVIPALIQAELFKRSVPELIEAEAAESRIRQGADDE